MQQRHFIDALIETYERAWSAHQAAQVSTELAPLVLETAIWCADAVAQNNWNGQGDRAAAVGAAMVRVLFPETAADEAAGLSAAVRLHIADADAPAAREAL